VVAVLSTAGLASVALVLLILGRLTAGGEGPNTKSLLEKPSFTGHSFLSRLKKEFRKPILIYLSKTDMFDEDEKEEIIQKFRNDKKYKEFKEAIYDIEELKSKIAEYAKE
jgi:hypothetical protein